MPGTPDHHHSAGEVPEPLVRDQLERIMASETFSRSDRLSAFLRFIVDQTLAGKADAIKEQVLACELYGRGADFAAAADSVVRVDARRLRDKLREYYAEFADEPMVIALRKGSYVPSFEWNTRASTPVPMQVPAADVVHQSGAARRARRMSRLLIAGAVMVTVVGLAGWLALPREHHDPMKLTPLTAYPGTENWPSLSPDGNFVAFNCAGPERPWPTDICVKEVGTEAFQRLVATPTGETFPAWSPDSREIAFARNSNGKELGVYTISRIGGPERKLSDTGSFVAWAPDGKSILIREQAEGEPFGISQLNLDTLERRRLTQPRSGQGDWSFAVSPDGETLAFIRYERPGVSDLYLVPMRGGDERRLTAWNDNVAGPAWTPDGKELIYAVKDRLWRIPASTATASRGSPIPDIPMPVRHVSISRPAPGKPARLAFHTPQEQISMRRVDLDSARDGGTFQTVLPFAPATRRDVPGRFSPDGSKVAFTSTRASSDHELWVADSDGANARQLTSFGTNRAMLAHSWSPDGRRILFDTAIDGNNDLYVISADGGKPVRMTSSPAIEGLGDWSRDGEWIYYTTVASNAAFDIWRMPAGGGPPERIASGGSEPQLSRDGRYVFYVTRPPLLATVNAVLMRVPSDGGDPAKIADGVSPLYWAVSENGVYLLRDEGQAHSVHLYRFADEKIVRLGALPFRAAYLQAPGRFTVSRDGRWALVNVVDRNEGDLMLLDNFR